MCPSALTFPDQGRCGEAWRVHNGRRRGGRSVVVRGRRGETGNYFISISYTFHFVITHFYILCVPLDNNYLV